MYLPAGEYLLQKTLDVPDNVTLRGDWKRPTDADRTVAGTILLIDHGAGTTGASVDGASVGLILRAQAGCRFHDSICRSHVSPFFEHVLI